MNDAIQPRPRIRLEQWGEGDFELLVRSNTPEMTSFLGGPEPEDKVHDRHARYLRYWQTGEACMFRIATDEAPDGVGAIGFWKTQWHGEDVYETGWSVETAHQGRGIAALALAGCIDFATVAGERELLLAFPRTDNLASNRLCERAGFELRGEEDFEYPKGNPIRSSAWAYRLRVPTELAGGSA